MTRMQTLCLSLLFFGFDGDSPRAQKLLCLVARHEHCVGYASSKQAVAGKQNATICGDHVDHESIFVHDVRHVHSSKSNGQRMYRPRVCHRRLWLL